MNIEKSVKRFYSFSIQILIEKITCVYFDYNGEQDIYEYDVILIVSSANEKTGTVNQYEITTNILGESTRKSAIIKAINLSTLLSGSNINPVVIIKEKGVSGVDDIMINVQSMIDELTKKENT